MSDFNQGVMGIPTGSAMNSVGLMYNGMYRQNQQENMSVSLPPKQICSLHEVRWSSDGERFTPTQFHINLVIIEAFVIFALCLIIAILWTDRK